MAFIFPEEAIAILRDSQVDPNASMGCEMLSGGVTWSDERWPDFVCSCTRKGCTEFSELVAYRTSLIQGEPRENLRFAWDEVRMRCPEWIGFRVERTSPSAELHAFIKSAYEEEW